MAQPPEGPNTSEKAFGYFALFKVTTHPRPPAQQKKLIHNLSTGNPHPVYNYIPMILWSNHYNLHFIVVGA
jgi:hypothetical protein